MEIAVKRSACMGSGPAIVPLNSSGCITLQWGVGRDLLFRLVPCYHIVLGGKLTSHLPLSRTVSTFLYLSDRRRTFSQKLGDNISIFTVFGINFQIHSVSLTSLVSIYLLIHWSTHLSHHPRPALIIHHSFILSLQALNLPFQQIVPTLDFFSILDCLVIMGLDRTYRAHHLAGGK